MPTFDADGDPLTVRSGRRCGNAVVSADEEVACGVLNLKFPRPGGGNAHAASIAKPHWNHKFAGVCPLKGTRPPVASSVWTRFLTLQPAD